MPHSSLLSCLLPLLVLSRLAPYRSNACAVETALCHPGAPACYPYRPALSLSLSPFFSFSPFLCLSLLRQLSSLLLAYLDPLFPSPYPSPHSAPVLLFGDFSLHLPSLPHHALHFAQCLPSRCAWAHFHEGDDPTWAPVTL